MVAIQLNKTVDDFLSGYSKLETPDERKEHKEEGEIMFEGFGELLRQYEDLLKEELAYIEEEAINSILSPEQINSFLQATIRYEDYKHFGWNTGMFITQLIQNSHEAGNNRFTLTTKAFSKRIDHIGLRLQGIGNKKLEILVEGDVGNFCAFRANNLGKLHINGNAGTYCCKSAWNIQEIYIGGTAKIYCGINTENCTFITPDQETLFWLKEHVEQDQGNKIYFIRPENQEEEIKW
ncbi:MAG: hypothetical protein ABIB71_06420 [Candidatus Woesearchaeota archaeon]